MTIKNMKRKYKYCSQVSVRIERRREMEKKRKDIGLEGEEDELKV